MRIHGFKAVNPHKYRYFQEITPKKSYYLGKDPIISYEKDNLVTPYYFKKENCYIESTLSADRAKYYSIEFLKNYDAENSFYIEIEYN